MNRRALVTGGTRGIGEEICSSLKNNSYDVIANYHRDHKTAEQFQKKYKIPVYSFDVSDSESCQKSLHEIEKSYGHIDTIIHNAGITRDVFLHKMQSNQWHDVINTNLNSCFNIVRPLIEGMRSRGFGRIIIISSINGQKGQIGQTNYSAAKAGIFGFVKALALESASKGITVNAVAPGYIETDMVRQVGNAILEQIKSHIPVGRMGQAYEVAQAVTFLASEQAGFITGSTLNMNGGQWMSS